MSRVLVIDNYDSFVYTLNGYLQELGAETTVVRNDAIAPEDVPATIAGYDAVLVSPGPGKPSDAGVSIDAIRAAAAAGTPLLGVCLGHQALAEAYGATVTNAEELMHGKTSRVRHDGSPFYAGLDDEFTATRYHSLAVVDGTVPDELVVTSRTPGGVIMGLRHRELPLFGVQFHPESVLTEGGYRMIGNWLELVGQEGAAARGATLSPLIG
ncbi:anthranilate synthase component II [Mycetocola reblochoni]|uniref:Anthranilate synthase, amidotransferase component @ Para-aminobenzoate synthase, amidotransferase component n=2 Tax=Mycetocola reblochoni TaxID=331618 RepID=A0A1R4JFT3_9MICO|nr:gamma-glutamyl-gamma-aminobutyrate hydrolase family protein [Mycetocola reblochoni]RLP67725.1 anthranilate synthase component II [Mycetocola reblochoni]SJN30878.1 Anthranilate synthase, amidotransferase component @ Para-aminobenzoate synthase, amidotransferase component [Mycetocola reblochoni REB411]